MTILLRTSGCLSAGLRAITILSIDQMFTLFTSNPTSFIVYKICKQSTGTNYAFTENYAFIENNGFFRFHFNEHNCFVWFELRDHTHTQIASAWSGCWSPWILWLLWESIDSQYGPNDSSSQDKESQIYSQTNNLIILFVSLNHISV